METIMDGDRFSIMVTGLLLTVQVPLRTACMERLMKHTLQTSTGYPRVTHPSAAQSPKLHSEEIRQGASLDLHVLSTPPAFILRKGVDKQHDFCHPKASKQASKQASGAVL